MKTFNEQKKRILALLLPFLVSYRSFSPLFPLCLYYFNLFPFFIFFLLFFLWQYNCHKDIPLPRATSHFRVDSLRGLKNGFHQNKKKNKASPMNDVICKTTRIGRSQRGRGEDISLIDHHGCTALNIIFIHICFSDEKKKRWREMNNAVHRNHNH